MRATLFCGAIALATAACAPSLTEQWSYPIEQNHSFVAGPVAFLSRPGGKPDRIAVATTKKEVLAFSGTGQLAWRAESAAQPVGIAAADLDGDGMPEILLTDNLPQLTCLSSRGDRRWRAILPAEPVGEPAAGDVNDAPGLEVVVADQNNGVTCLTAKGQVLWHTRCNTGKRPENADPFIGPIGFWWPRYRDDDMGAPPTLADVDGDGKAEVLAASSDRHTYCLEGDGTWKWDIAGSHKFRARPVAADLDRDGSVEVLAGCLDRNIYCVEGATGRVLWKYRCEFGLDSAITTADLNGDGKLEVIAGDQKCFLHCLDSAGKPLWKLDLHPGESIKHYGDRILAAPAVADVDGNGRLEIVLGIRGDEFLYVISDEGRIEEKYEMEQGPEVFLADSGVHGPVAVGDFDGDGRAEIVAAARRTALRCLSTGAPWRPISKQAEPIRRVQPVSQPAPGSILKISTPSQLYVGENDLTISVDEAHLGKVRGPFVAEAVVQPPSGPRTILIEHLQPGSYASTPTFRAIQQGPYKISARLIPEGARFADSFASAQAELTHGSAEKALAEKAAQALQRTAARLEPTNSGGAKWLRRWAACLRAEQRNLPAARDARDEGAVLERWPPLRQEAERALETAERLHALTEANVDTRLIAWQANPWERFLENTLPPVEVAPFSRLKTFTYLNEYESLAFNLANFSGENLTLRFQVGDLSGPAGSVRSRDHVIVRQVQLVPRQDGQYSSDALPLLAEGNILTLPNATARQIWITLRTKGLRPGHYFTSLTITSLTTHPIARSIGIEFDVLPISLPEKSPIWFCNWAYVETQVFKHMPEVAVADLVEHYTNVFPTGMFTEVKYDSEGNLLPIDWTRFDELVRRYKGHGRFLFEGWEPLQHQGDAPEKEGAREKAFAAWMRALAQHLRSLGVGYDGWANINIYHR